MTLLLAHIVIWTRPLLRFRSLWLCLFSLALLWPHLAVAASVPMTSPFGETIAAPPPESPPTGGEIRSVSRVDPRAPTLNLAPLSDPGPLPWELPSPDPAVVGPQLSLLVAPAIAMPKPNPAAERHGSLGVRTEVFRPPCPRSMP